ncbi:uncharacterized protein LOC143586490 [Bidens hawaiensis]|uniref:uncharacterized protein LOC143586490 n=1 Tax=Bidens hawaiensis TaxID=980011 RepID=UPI00404949FB
MIKKAVREESEFRSQSRQSRNSRSVNPSQKSQKSRLNPSRVEESVHESNADGGVRREFKKLKISGCSFKDFKYYGPKEFHGDKGAIITVRWLEEMETIVITSKCFDEEKIQYSALMFKGEALEWWNTLLMSKGREVMYGLTWNEFKALLMGKFCPMHETDQIQTKFLNLKVVGTNLRDYNTKFHEYCPLVPQLVNPESRKVTRYIWGLPREIRDMVRSHLT